MQLLKSEWTYLLPALLVLLASLRSKYVPVDTTKPLNNWQTLLLWLQRWLTAYAPAGTTGIAGTRLSVPVFHVPALEKPGQSAPGGVAKALLPFLFAGLTLGATLPGCGYCSQQANVNTARCKAQRVTVNCGAPEVVKIITAIMPDVLSALISQNWSPILDQIVGSLEQRGENDAWGILTCAIHQATAASKTSASPDEAIRYAHGQLWLDSHPAKVKW